MLIKPIQYQGIKGGFVNYQTIAVINAALYEAVEYRLLNDSLIDQLKKVGVHYSNATVVINKQDSLISLMETDFETIYTQNQQLQKQIKRCQFVNKAILSAVVVVAVVRLVISP